MMRHMVCFCAILLGAVVWGAEPPPMVPVLQLTGRPQGQCPDVLVLAPQFTEATKAYTEIFSKVADIGTTLKQAVLTLEDFTEGGPMSTLRAAGYQMIPVRDLSWEAACVQVAQILELRQRTRNEDGLAQTPICVILQGEATPAALQATLEPFLDSEAMIFLLSPVPELPLTVVWRNTIWPNNATTLTVRPEHWVPTLATIAALPPPANVAAASILPTLTGVGYQRPLELPEMRSVMSVGQRTYTLMSVYRRLPERCPWVPDYTLREAILPSETAFLPSSLPVSAQAIRGFSKSHEAQGLYLRSQQKALAFTIPEGASCVVRLKGVPVVDLWEAKEDTPWAFEAPEETTVEIFFLLPAGMPLEKLDLFGAKSP